MDDIVKLPKSFLRYHWKGLTPIEKEILLFLLVLCSERDGCTIETICTYVSHSNSQLVREAFKRLKIFSEDMKNNSKLGEFILDFKAKNTRTDYHEIICVFERKK